jgi:hypothetical protein
MATQKITIAGALGGFAFMLTAGMLMGGTAQAASYTCSGGDNLPCMVAGSTDVESSVEWLLSDISNQFVDLTLLDEVDHQFWVYPQDKGSNYKQTAYSTSGDLKVTASTWQWVKPGDGPYGGGYYQGIGGSATYFGDISQIDYITISGYDGFIAFDAHDLINGNSWTWNTANLFGTNKLVHVALWTVKKTVDEPMALALMLTGLTALAWRRSRKPRIA